MIAKTKRVRAWQGRKTAGQDLSRWVAGAWDGRPGPLKTELSRGCKQQATSREPKRRMQQKRTEKIAIQGGYPSARLSFPNSTLAMRDCKSRRRKRAFGTR